MGSLLGCCSVTVCHTPWLVVASPSPSPSVRCLVGSPTGSPETPVVQSQRRGVHSVAQCRGLASPGLSFPLEEPEAQGDFPTCAACLGQRGWRRPLLLPSEAVCGGPCFRGCLGLTPHPGLAQGCPVLECLLVVFGEVGERGQEQPMVPSW